MLSTRFVVPLLCGLLISFPAQAAVTIIHFDSFPGMTNIPGLSVPSASQLSDQLLPTLGVSFRSAAGYVAVANHSPAPTVSMPNVIGGVTADGKLSYGTFVRISFFDPSNPIAKAVTDFISIRGDQEPLPGATATMEAFDVLGQSLGTVSANDSSVGLTLSLTLPGIHSILLTQDSDAWTYDGTIGFDNLQFNSIPAPGAILLGWLRRRKTL
jgi:hypothetical protein